MVGTVGFSVVGVDVVDLGLQVVFHPVLAVFLHLLEVVHHQELQFGLQGRVLDVQSLDDLIGQVVADRLDREHRVHRRVLQFDQQGMQQVEERVDALESR